MSETVITQNIERRWGRWWLLLQFYFKAHYKLAKERTKWSKVAASVLFLAEWTVIINSIYMNCLGVHQNFCSLENWMAYNNAKQKCSFLRGWEEHLVCCMFVQISLCSPSRWTSVCLSHTPTLVRQKKEYSNSVLQIYSCHLFFALTN